MLIVVDLDGTLLNGQGVINDKEKEWIKKYLATKNYFGIITTRNYQDGWPVVGEFVSCAKNNLFFAFDEGRHIICPNNEKIETPCLSNEELKEVLSLSNGAIGYTLFSDTRCMDCLKSLIKVFVYTLHNRMVKKNHRFCTMNQCKKKNISDVWKIRINYNSDVNIDKEYRKLASMLKDVSVINNENRIEIMSKKSGKLGSLEIISNMVNIPLQNVVYIGDEGNDLYCLENTNSFAMGNAPDWVKARAKHVTDDNTEFGVLKVFETIERNNLVEIC